MPGRRKRPPQDSIDSILLAISRRDNIDSDTLSHYFDRLDEEWTEGARDKVLHLLRTHDPSAHAAAVLILTELATDFDLEELEDLVADPTVTDMAKLTLAPVLKELNSEMADDGLIDYLNDPEAAMQQMQVRLLELVGQSELGVESILEDILSMPLERRLGFINWLGNSHDSRAAKLLIPLLENQTGKIVTAAVEALEQLGRETAHLSIPALNYLINHTSNRQLKQQARTALGRLTMQSTPGIEDSAMADADARHQLLRFHEARVSFIDGTGAQMIMLSWIRPDGLLKGVNILYQDQWGIKDCYGTDEMDIDRWTELVSGMESQGFGSFRVPLAYGRNLIAEAYALSKRTRHKLPVAYAIWRPLIESDEASSEQQAEDASTALTPCELNDETRRLARRGHELYELSEFVSWLYEPFERIQPYIDRYWAQRRLMELGNSGTRGRNRKNAARKAANSVDVEAIITETITDVVDTSWRTLYESRLLRQGKLFQFAERTSDAQLTCAVAAALHPDSSLAQEEQPFLRMMMRLTIEQGPLRAIAEALNAGKFGPLPIDLFPDVD
ncbi:MAG TPA: HEAT repeat domain-containing protein [Ktedonobacteraceae bacterium]|nr:HEAT repeat domain-containing protein [Ktedonobacteraceae bacterium]